MEIVRRGKPPSERVYEGSCYICKTVVRFKHGEAKYNSDQRDGDYLSILCPVCNYTIAVAADRYLRELEGRG